MINNNAKLINSDEESLRIAMEGWQVGMWTAIPGIIQSVNLSKMTCTVQPAITEISISQQGVQTPIKIPLLLDVPIVFPSGGGFTVTFPLAADDEVLVVFSSRCIDAWWQQGDIQPAMEARMHDLSDGFAIPGPKSVPNVIGSISSSKLQIRNDAGTVFFGVGSKFSMANPTTDLKTVLTDLYTLLNAFMGTLAALTPPSTPVVNSTLQVPASTAVSSLSALLVKINALLEAS